MGIMRILDSTGDSVVAWDLTDNTAVREAEQLFEKLQREGKIPFARISGGEATLPEQITNFDADAAEIIWVRPIQGG